MPTLLSRRRHYACCRHFATYTLDDIAIFSPDAAITLRHAIDELSAMPLITPPLMPPLFIFAADAAITPLLYYAYAYDADTLLPLRC